MVTGGDDLPVLALLLLGVVLAERRRPSLAGVAFGLAATLKLTAWPALVLMTFAVRDKDGRPAPWRYASGRRSSPSCRRSSPAWRSGPEAFFENVVSFPLGLAHVKSPAASPLLGEVLTTVFPGDRRVVTAVLGFTGLVLVVAYLARHTPRTPAEVCAATAFVLFAATVLAPATRFGYLIYPANFVVWAYVLDGLGRGGDSASVEVVALDQPKGDRARRGGAGTPECGADRAVVLGDTDLDLPVVAVRLACAAQRSRSRGRRPRRRRG